MSTEKSDEVPKGYSTDETRATRLKPDTERDYLRYREEHDLTDAEALRRLVRKALDKPERSRLENVARYGEKVLLVGVIAGLLTVIIPVGSGAAVDYYGLTVGTFGLGLIVGTSLLAGAVAIIAGAVAFLIHAYIIVIHGIEVGWFGRQLGKVLGDRGVTA